MAPSEMDSFFVYQVERWYKRHQRPLPWRQHPTPYTVWLAEIIFQQTRIDQGMRYYLKFIEEFPDIQSLADASEDKILKMWQGLGYYTRAINLHKTAKIIAARGGEFPQCVQELKRLPGIGPYTAGAIASIAFGRPASVVDGNVLRIISRFYGISDPIDQPKTLKDCRSIADRVVRYSSSPSAFNQGLMDLGSAICKPAKPLCTECDLADKCYAFTNGLTDVLPLKHKKPVKTNRFLYFAYMEWEGKVAIQKRDAQDIWKNLYQLPLLIDTFSEEEKNEFEQRMDTEKILFETRHVLSHQILHLKVIQTEQLPAQVSPESLQYVQFNQIAELGFPVPFQKFFSKMWG